jgi:hypothetical protein
VGGPGSGREAKDGGRRTTDGLPALDVRALKQEGLIAPGQEQLIDVARLAWTSCGFGGKRAWFVCPGGECGRRAAILYLDGRDRLLCRSCLDLSYPSQREDSLRRARRRALKARARLGHDPTIRPKGMHRATFERLRREFLNAYNEHVVLYNKRFAKLRERLSERNFRLIKRMEQERIEQDL